MSLERPDFPQRIFLDSSTLQTMLRYGEYLYDGGEVGEDDRIHRDPVGLKKLEDLRTIMEIAQRAPFSSPSQTTVLLKSATRRIPLIFVGRTMSSITGNARPATVEKLLNTIRSRLAQLGDVGDHAETILGELSARAFVRVAEKKVTYALPRSV